MYMWDQLKSILHSSNEKAIIIEDGKPTFVVMSIEEYLKLQDKDKKNLQNNNNTDKNNSQNYSQHSNDLEHIKDYIDNNIKSSDNLADNSVQSEFDNINVDKDNRGYADDLTDIENFPY